MHRFVLLIVVGLAASPPGQGQAVIGLGRAPIDEVSAACREGIRGKCLEAGNRYRFGDHAPQDPAQAVQHYHLACKGGDAYACKALHELGLGYLKGKDHRGKRAPEDHAKAAEAFELSCAGGYGPGCTSLAKAFQAGDGVAKNPARAAELFILACDKGSRWGCRHAGDEVAGANPEVARSYYDKACGWKDGPSCAILGKAFLDGTGVPRDEKKAFNYFLRSCNQAPADNDTQGCFALARLYDHGTGVEKNRVEAVRLYGQACSVLRPKEAEACFLLAAAYKLGDGVKADANAAGQYFQQACQLGSKKGCVEWHLDTCKRLGQPSSCGWLEKEGVREH